MWDNLSISYISGTNRMSGFTNSASGYEDYINMGHDANGNVNLYMNADYTTSMTLEYDAYDRMVSVDEEMGTTITQYRYNSDGWRYYRKRGSLNPVYSIRDGSISLAEYTGTTGGVTWNIVLPDGTPIGRKPFSSGKSFYYRDHLGSTRTVVYENGTIQQVLDYYPFGLEMSGRGMVSGSPVLQRFTGYERTSESMLDYAGARWYNPRLGRFWSVDPMAGEFPAWSPYNYALNDPLRYVDPDGRAARGSDCCNFTFQRVVGDFFNFSVNRTQQNVQAAVTNVQTDAIIMVKEGPGALDYVTMGAAGTTVFAGGVAFKTGTPLAATIAGVAATTALISEGTAWGVSGIDALFLGGHIAEFQSRTVLFGIGFISGQTVKLGTNRVFQKYLPGIHQIQRDGAAEAAGATGGIIIQEIIKKDDDELDQ